MSVVLVSQEMCLTLWKCLSRHDLQITHPTTTCYSLLVTLDMLVARLFSEPELRLPLMVWSSDCWKAAVESIVAAANHADL